MDIHILVDSAGQEKVRYDSSRFPLYIARGDLLSFPHLSAPCHWHEDLELICVQSGRMDYNVDGEITCLQAGEGIFVNSRHLHYGFSHEGKDCSYLCILLQPMLLQLNDYVETSFLSPLLQNESFPIAHLRPAVSWQREILELTERVYQTYQTQVPGFELDLLSSFYRILALLCRNMPAQQHSAVHPARQRALRRIKAMVSYMEENLADGVQLAAVAAAADVSISTCSHLFRRYLHRTPMEYLSSLRLDRGCRWLLETDMPMTDIASELGFSSPSYFAECFRKAYGCPPSEYRRRHRSGPT